MSINRSDILWKINARLADWLARLVARTGASFLRRTCVTIRTSELRLRVRRVLAVSLEEKREEPYRIEERKLGRSNDGRASYYPALMEFDFSRNIRVALRTDSSQTISPRFFLFLEFTFLFFFFFVFTNTAVSGIEASVFPISYLIFFAPIKRNVITHAIHDSRECKR